MNKHNKNKFENYYNKRFINTWKTKLSFDSFYKNPNSDPNKGIYSFNINPTTSQTYSNYIGSSERLENIIRIRIDKFSIPLPKLCPDLEEIDNSFNNPNIDFKDSPDFIDQNELVESDFNHMSVSLTGSEYLKSYRSLISNGKIYIGIKEFAKQSTSLDKSKYYHFEFDAEFIAHPYPSLMLTPSNDYNYLEFTTPLTDITILTFEFFTECGRLILPKDCLLAKPLINQFATGELQFIINENIEDITDFSENLRGTKIKIPNFTFSIEDRSGTINNQNGDFIRNSKVFLQSGWGELENYIKNNSLYMDHQNDNEIIILPTPINLDGASGIGGLTNIDFIEPSDKRIYPDPTSSTTQWTYSDFNLKSKTVEIKLLAHRVRIPVQFMGLVDQHTR